MVSVWCPDAQKHKESIRTDFLSENRKLGPVEAGLALDCAKPRVLRSHVLPHCADVSTTQVIRGYTSTFEE